MYTCTLSASLLLLISIVPVADQVNLHLFHSATPLFTCFLLTIYACTYLTLPMHLP